MGLLAAVSFSLVLVSLTQIPYSDAGCRILTAAAAGPSSILVKWEKYAGATNYFLDLRVKNNTRIAPVVVTLSATRTERIVQGLQPGTNYSVTIKVFQFYFVVCMNTSDASTVPDTSQIIDGRSLTSTSIMVKWTEVPSADRYFLQVRSQDNHQVFNLTLTGSSAVVGGLLPSTNYDCFLYTLNHAGMGSQSKVRTVTTLMQPPVGVTATQTGRDTATVTWQPVEDVLVYHVDIRDIESDGVLSAYNISDTRLDVHGILPCSTYLISVSSFSRFLVPSEPTHYTYTTNKLAPVSSVSVDYSCTTHSVMVQWAAVFGAESYEATAVGEDGTQLRCSSQSTSCDIGGLSCGQMFVVHVTPTSDNCKNTVNTTSATFHTVPCPPGNLQLLRDCSSEVIIFSWQDTNNTDHYMARAVDSQGGVQECLTEENSCYFTRTACGRHYYFTVYSIKGPCRSQISSTADIRTAPCIPQNVQTSADCNSNNLLSKWDLAEGALRYSVEAFGNRGNHRYNCSTLSNSCAIEGVHCGEFLTIYITAFDDECASPRTLGPVAETVPCTPQNVTAVKECGAGSITMTWTVSGSTLFYVAMAMDSSGAIHSCNSMDLTCTFEGLKCSTAYTAYVIGSNFMCNSSESEAVVMETAACPPDNVAASLDCAANEALISWRGQTQIHSYTASMVDEDQGLLSCSSTTTSCRVPDLKCGVLYAVTVSHHDGVCPSRSSQPLYMESVPCGPQVDAHLDCQSQVLTVGWNASSEADGYVAVISDGSTQTSYNTTEAALRISSLQCGRDYSLTVASVHGACSSHASVSPVWRTPCVPTAVVAEADCGRMFVDVSWQASRGASHYRAAALHADGQQLLCASNQTRCRLEGLTCSRVYSVAVAAGNGSCTSNQSAAVDVRTAPCPPPQLTASVDCANNSAVLTWNSSSNAVSYTGRAVGSDQHTVTCDAGAALGCRLEALRCGQEYTFTVSASDGSCQSPDSEPVVRTTAPCVLQNVTNTLNCSSNMLSVRWASGSVPVSSTATATAGDGTVLECITEDSSCTMTNLQCGQSYAVSVTAAGSTCRGPGSVPALVHSVPCAPVNIRGVVQCSSGSLTASWDAAAGAASYISTLTGPGYSSSCPTSTQSCLFLDLQCAHTYMLTVVAQNNECSSSASAEVSVTAAPCGPTDVAATLDCVSGVSTVSWSPGAAATYYTVVAEADGHVDLCRSTNTSCELRRLRCGADYTVSVLAGDGSCNSSAHGQTNITTAPCAPVIQDHSLDCGSNRASVSWAAQEDATGVAVHATSTQGHSTSCSSTGNSSCVLRDLRCGHTYSVEAVAGGAQCPSRPSPPLEMVTAPCSPANVEHRYSCETGVASLSWDEAQGRRTFNAHVVSEDHTASCSTTQTNCTLPVLLCGRTYDVAVIAVAERCNSSEAGVTRIQTAPCAPVDVSASLLCDNNTAAVSWLHGSGSETYSVTALGGGGDVKRCTTNSTSCHLPNMHCAQTYEITVTPFSNRCRGSASPPHNYTAGPCPPTDVAVSLQCVGNVGHVTWSPAPHADLYVATALPSADDQPDHRCTSNGTGCSLTDLRCGGTAVLTVVTVERGCRSEPSPPLTFHSAVCPPAAVAAATTCSNNDVTVSWEPSPRSAVTYLIHSQEGGGAGAEHSTTQTSHVIGGLRCGESYTLTVAAEDTECTSVASEAIRTQTAPCPPTNLTARAECGTNLGVLRWAASPGAVSYTATATGSHGHVVSCSSNSTTCPVKLHCGRQYSAAVVASGETCNSSAGADFTFESAPCLPDRVTAELHCSDNLLEVQWGGGVVEVGSYTAIAIGSDESRASCETTNTTCTIRNIKCGLTYGVVVTSPSVDCGTIRGSDYTVQSAPCEPDRVLVDLQCSTNEAAVAWGNAGPDQTQVVSAVDSRGRTSTCNSSSSNCTLDRLLCGESYSISVVGHTNSCSSDPAAAETLHTAPCVPTHVTARGDCQTAITVVTWDGSRGATSYTVRARGSLGHDAECNSTDTNCDFQNLACGQDYAITVVARHQTCVSLVSGTVYTSTGPCPHSGLKTTLDCHTNTAVISWTPGSGIRYYNASADAFDVDHQATCSTNTTSCNISSLRCGERYKVSVSGQGQNCPSPAQDWQRITTAPCPPTQLQVASSCESDDISVSWQPSQGSATYTAVAEDGRGRLWSCNTSSTSCQISGLFCGRRYRVYAAGVDERCTGAKSNIQEIQTAPCVPQNVQSDLNCRVGVLNVTWRSAGHAAHFTAALASSAGHISSCRTVQHHCVFTGMACDLTYNVTVVAEDEACSSSNSPPQQVTTAPCPLTSVLPTVDCNTSIVSVSWTDGVAGVVYTVSAADSAGHRHNCSGTDGGCDVDTLRCGTEYSVTVTPSRDGCVGRDSPATRIRTAPCTPRLSDVEIDCLTNSAWVMWDEAAGAEDYVVMATDSQGDRQTFECNSTSDGACALPPLACSRNVTFTVTARDQQCPSGTSNAVTTETAPCHPEDVEKSVGCLNRTASISWAAVPGAVTYTATLEQVDGGTACCTTSDTGCDIADLPCGEMYVLLVTAEGRTCNSSQSVGDIVRTAPCVPRNLTASLSCSDNVASMYWNRSRGGQLYHVRASTIEGHVDECTSHENSCDLRRLRCGLSYAATVTAEDSDCQSSPSRSVTIRTVPCTPATVHPDVDCGADTLTVSWSESSGADSYIATVQDSNGQTTTCQGTTEGSCNVTGVGCGQIYRVSAVSSDGYCNSRPTEVVGTPSAPCEPRLIEAELDCYMRTTTVAWYPSDGALRYEVKASASDHGVSCETNNTHCDLDGLLCGHSYSVSVAAVGQICTTVAHMTEQLVTEPCVPEHVTTRYSLTIGQVLWDMAAGAGYYTAEAVTEEGLLVSCTTNDTYCPMYNLGCGQTYGINVTANNHVCQGVSTSTETVIMKTEPCPPNNVQTSVQCRNDMAIVSWEASLVAVSYAVRLAGRDGHSLSCYTEDPFCNIEGLHCGVVYYTNVIAIGDTLNSSISTTALLVSAPCAAGNVTATLDCSNNTAEVSWGPAGGADSYAVTAVSADGQQASCETDEHRCDLMELPCGQTYNVSLTAVSDRCQTETHTAVPFSTRPCKPLQVGVDLRCGTGAANMYWEQTEEVEFYMATATCSEGVALQCNSTNSTCQFSKLHCGETYMFSVAACSNSCCSETSSTVEAQTEPCQPTDLVADGSCDNETVVLSWSEAKGASVYVVKATGDLGYVTSFQTQEPMIEAELPCGQLFTFIVKAQDDGCSSSDSQPAVFRTGPCMPQHVQSFTHCEDSLGSVSWADSDGAESYLAIATGRDGHAHACTTNTTSCTWEDLHCGELYTVHVISNDHLCSSRPSNSTSIRMASCIPDNLQSSMNCTMKVGSLTWNGSEASDFYIVTAETNSGHKVQLSTNETWTFISEFHCGRVYYLSVQAVDSECTSRPSRPSELQTEPCPPAGVSSFMNCLSNIAVLSWTDSAGAEFYTATVTQGDGQSQSCWSDSEQCGMPNVPCGQNYTVTVVASSETCHSDPSEVNMLQSVPCVPTDVDVEVDCSTNQAVVSWRASGGALSYKVTAQSSQGAGTSSCEGTDQTCTLTNLTCGQTYMVQVVAQDDVCSSLPSPAVKFQSVPCPPSNGSVVLDCFTNSALLDWAFAEGALKYTATARSSGGHVSTCDTNNTNCELQDLQCGQTYDVVTVASNGECDSPPGSRVQVESVPCPPKDVMAVLDCSSNAAVVRWQASGGADSYTVQALGVQEYESGCETASQSCVLSDLLCGSTYNISVTAANSVCNTSQSAVTQLPAVPCVPQRVAARVLCGSGAVAVSWEPSKGALSYITVAQGSGGYASACNSSETTCLFNDLLCGLNYSIAVRASDGRCSSAGSSAVELNTVPCVPQMVTAATVCSNDTGLVSWEEGEGVTSYTVRAFGPDGHKTRCNSTATSCQLPSMHCGQLYNVTVTAQDGRCDDSHAYVTLQSAPCRPTNVRAALRCHSDSAAVTWERASGAASYRAVGVTSDGSHRIECNSTVTHCDLSDLLCGRTYSVSVSGQDEFCSSMESDKAYVRTAPCPPLDVAVDARCAEEAMTVSWSHSPDAQYYHVVAESSTGPTLLCNSSGTGCTMNDLPCGQEYNVTVVSVGGDCESRPSAAVETSSAPCVPEDTFSRLDCVSNSAWVTWADSAGALSYVTLAQEAGGHNSTCSSTSSPCSVPDLKCASRYTFHVTAVNKHCRSNHSNTFELETGPCALSSVSAVTRCNSATILVEWELSTEAPLYLVTAEGQDRSLISCNSSSTSCELWDVRCDMLYSIIVSSSSDKCSSLRSPPKKIKTAPCAPEGVTAEPFCEQNGATVTWSSSPVATSYLLTATGSDGHVNICNTSVNNCTLADLHCGQSYSLSITASGDDCTSEPATASLTTVPCAPSSPAVDVECENNSAFLSWNSSDGAVKYFGCARSLDGDALYCDTTSTSCTIQGLECGDVYNFSVEASDGACNSSSSAPLQEGAAPCAPTGLSVRMRVIGQTQWAMTSWETVHCTNVEYLVEITGRLQDNPNALMSISSYWLSWPYFDFLMPCSAAYNLTVRSRNSAGVSEPSSAFTGVTVPCAPKSVMYSGNNQSAVLSWEASVFATSYSVYKVSEEGRVPVCSTTGLSCQLTSFEPGATEVTASNAHGESVPNQNITGPVGPRRRRDLRATQVLATPHKRSGLGVPELLDVTVSGISLHVKWTTVKDATEYTLVIEEEQWELQADQTRIVRAVEGDFYIETDLRPWTTYCIRLAARNTVSHSSYCRPTCTTTGAQ